MGFERYLKLESTNHHQQIVETMAEWLQKDSQNQVFYLIPDHIKVSAEMDMIKKVGMAMNSEKEYWASTRLQVFSFNRLAWYLLEGNPTANKHKISQTGMAMIIQKILLENQNKLPIFKEEVRRKGFIEQLVELFLELRQGGVTPEDLLGEFNLRSDEQSRLKEFSLIYQEFQKALEGKYIDSEVLLKTLAEKIKTSDLSKTLVIIDHKNTFNAGELKVLEALVDKSYKTKLYTSLSMDAIKTEQNEQSIYYSNHELLERVTNYLADYGHKVVSTKEVKDTNSVYDAEFKEIEQFWLSEHNGIKEPIEKGRTLNSLSITSFNNHHQELQEVVAKIYQLVKSGGYRYKDIQLLSRNLDKDSVLLEALFKQYQVPYFIDLTDTMAKHPLAQLIDSIFAIKKNDWQYNDIMKLLRTELAFWPIGKYKIKNYQRNAEKLTTITTKVNNYRNKVDKLENVMIKNGYEGSSFWENNTPWETRMGGFSEDELKFKPRIEKEIKVASEYRLEITNILHPFYEKLNQKELTTQDAMKALFDLFENLGVETALLYWQNLAEVKGEIALARQYQQVWNKFIELVNEYVEIFGEEAFNYEQFDQILRTGFNQIHYGMAPTTMNQVICTGIDSIRYNPSKVTFVVGATKDVLPKLYDSKSLLTDEEREVISAKLDGGRSLHPSSEVRQASEPFVFYQTLLSATEHIYFSYPLAIAGNSETQEMSPYLERIKEQFEVTVIDGAKEQAKRFENCDFYSESEVYRYVLSGCRKLKEASQDNQEVQNAQTLALILAKHPEYKATYEQLMQSVYRENKVAKIPVELVEELFGETVKLSVSKVELYYKDPFSYFLQHGLKLKEREEVKVDVRDIGNYFHDSMDLVVKKLSDKDKRIENLSYEELEESLDKIFKELDGLYKYNKLGVTKRMEWLRQQLQVTVRLVCRQMQQQQNQLMLKPYESEFNFSKEIKLKNDSHKIELNGKIDRVDYAETSTGKFVSVLDYKSGKKDIDLNKVVAGLQLQLLVYLGIATEELKDKKDKDVKAFGAFYEHIYQPKIDVNKISKKHNKKQARFKEFSYKGLMATDEALIDLINPLDGTPSLVLPYGVKKTDGKFTKDSKVISSDDLENLIKYANYQVEHAAKMIYKGEFPLYPCKDEKYIPTVDGQYVSISQFDASLPETKYKVIEKETVSTKDKLGTKIQILMNEQISRKIKKQLGDDETDE